MRRSSTLVDETRGSGMTVTVEVGSGVGVREGIFVCDGVIVWIAGFWVEMRIFSSLNSSVFRPERPKQAVRTSGRRI
jgi:hypothetical protein